MRLAPCHLRSGGGARLTFNVSAPGIKYLDIRWPVGSVDYQRRRDNDAAALARGDYPYVLPIFGEIQSARVLMRLPM